MNTKSIFWINLLGLLCISHFAFSTALDDYLTKPDPHFKWEQFGPSVLDGNPLFGNTGTRGFVLELTSQGWRGPGEVDTTVWKHWVTVIVPEYESWLGEVKDVALVLINEGDIGEPAPLLDGSDPAYDDLRNLAAGTRTVMVELRSVPNQPLKFSDETFGRSEDEIIAYSWDKFLRGGDDEWPVQLPMVKSTVRCIDAVQAFMDEEYGKNIDRFVLTGGSKRGWTAWLTAAVDLRVKAIAPIVSDLLNMRRSFGHHWSCYGFWADALWPYEEMGIFDWFDSPRIDELLAIVDPFEYRNRLDLPKYMVTAAGDDFFVHDSVQFYIDGLLGETYIRTVPNTNHYLDGAYADVFLGMLPYYDAFLTGQGRPEFSWTLNDNGSMTVDTTDGPAPVEVILWQADNPSERDFRQVTIGNTWTASILAEQSPGIYLADPGMPAEGWRSYFVELVYDYETPSIGIGDFDYHFTTEVRVIPEVRPYEADWSRDRVTDIEDVALLAEYWLASIPYFDIIPRRNGDGKINLEELSMFSIHWLEAD